MKTKPNSPIEQFKNFVRQPYAWPGGYPMFALMDDCEAVCRHCATKHARQIIDATVHDYANGWRCDAVAVNWEDDLLTCAHCGENIESAYSGE